jgi:hypothetical protein
LPGSVDALALFVQAFQHALDRLTAVVRLEPDRSGY